MSTPFLKHGYICIDKKKKRIIAVNKLRHLPLSIVFVFKIAMWSGMCNIYGSKVGASYHKIPPLE